MIEIYEKKYDILKTEWSFTQDSIRNLDDIVFKIRGWAITLTSGALGYAYVNKDPDLCIYMSLPILMFWIMDGLFKSFQRKFIKRDREIRSYLRSENFVNDFKKKDITLIQITASFSARPSNSGWTINGFKNQLKAMFLRNVVFSYLPIVLFQSATYLLLI